MKKKYKGYLTYEVNQKGVLDIDTIKGCYHGIKNNPKGCWGLCYARKIARFRGLDFGTSQVRTPKNKRHLKKIARDICLERDSEFIRIGTMGDPSYDWSYTIFIAKYLHKIKPIIIITKHWIKMTDEQMKELGKVAIVNTSISALDTKEQREYRLGEYERYKQYGKSILRIVSCEFNREEKAGKELAEIQDKLFKKDKTLDNPLRVNPSYFLVKDNVIKVKKVMDINSEVYMSKFNPDTYVGVCKDCPDKCGITL